MTRSETALLERDSGLGERERRLLRVLTASTFVVILNETIMVNAIPVLMDVLAVGARSAQWLSSGFMLTMAVVIPVTGWFLQRVTTRAAYATAMGLFCAGTLLAAVAPSFAVLLTARIVQAAGTAVMFPLLMTTLLTLVPPAQRGRVMGNVTLAISVAPALGPALSGLILHSLSWRWLFVLVLPIAGGLAVWGLRTAPTGGDVSTGRPDLLSIALTAVGFGGLVYGLSQVGGDASAIVPPWALIGLGVVGLGAFATRQLYLQRVGVPLLDLRVLRHRGYVVALAAMSLAFMALMGAIILIPLYLQQVHRLDALTTGLILMPGGLAMGLFGPVVGRLYDRFGARRLVVPGSMVMVAALVLMTAAVSVGASWLFMPLHVALSVALAFVFTPVFTAGLGFLPQNLYSHGSAILGSLQQVAAAAGTALVVTVMVTRASSSAADGASATASMSSGVQLALGVCAVIAVGVLASSFLQRTPGGTGAGGGAGGDAEAESANADSEADVVPV